MRNRIQHTDKQVVNPRVIAPPVRPTMNQRGPTVENKKNCDHAGESNGTGDVSQSSMDFDADTGMASGSPQDESVVVPNDMDEPRLIAAESNAPYRTRYGRAIHAPKRYGDMSS